MSELDPKSPEARKKRTAWLLAGGAASLLIPLAGAIYVHLNESLNPHLPTAHGDMFERREGQDLKLTPTQTVVPPSSLTTPPLPSGMILGAAGKPSADSSLDFIKSGDDLRAQIAGSKAAAPAPAVAAPPAPAAPASVAASTSTAKAAKPGRKTFAPPKLQPTRGFTNFGSGNSNGSQASPAGGSNSQDVLKNLPPAAAQYLQKQQGQ